MKVVKTEQCQVTDLKTGTNSVILFQQLDAALPFFPEQAESILQWAQILQELNVYGLKVTGLKPGSYEVRLGGKAVTRTTDKELAQGINLSAAALSKGPVAAQVKAVVAAVEAKNRYFHERIFRGVTLAACSIPDFVENGKELTEKINAQRASAFTQRMAEMPKYDEAIRKALIIEPHSVELVWSDPTEGHKGL